jgi:hypothetical protein
VNSVPSEWNLQGGSFLGGAASDFQISQDSTSKFYIVGATGNVGIGSTSPSKKLVVDGAIGFTAGNYIGSGLGWDGTASGAAASSTIQLYSLSDGGMTLASGLLKFQTSGSERMRIDSSGNLGIGTAAPANYAGYTTLTLNHATNGGIIDFQNNGTRKGEIYNTASDFGVYADTGVTLNFWAGAANYADIDTAGNFVWSQTNTSGGNTGLCYDGSGASVWGSCTSLAAYKENVKDLELGLETVLALRPVTFDWKSSGTPDLGFIAEEVEEVNSLLAEHGGRDGTLSGVKYNTMSALLVRAFQELYTGFISRFTRQDEKLDALEERIQTLEALVAGAGISGSLNSPPPPESRQPSPEPAVEESSAEPTSIEAPALEPMPETENILTEEKPQVPTAEEIPPSE